MRHLIMLLFVASVIVSCTSTATNTDAVKNKHDKNPNDLTTANKIVSFRSYSWNETQDAIIAKESPIQAKTYESDGVVQLEFEGSFLGVATNLDDNCVARMTCFFTDNQLKGGWYYIYTKKSQFDLKAKTQELVVELGAATKTVNSVENSTKVYLWELPTKTVKLLARDAGDFVRFELYTYEKSWYDKNKGIVAKEFVEE